MSFDLLSTFSPFKILNLSQALKDGKSPLQLVQMPSVFVERYYCSYQSFLFANTICYGISDPGAMWGLLKSSVILETLSLNDSRRRHLSSLGVEEAVKMVIGNKKIGSLAQM